MAAAVIFIYFPVLFHVCFFASGFVGASLPPASPENVVISVNATSAIVQWTPPPPQRHSDTLVGYKVEVNGSSNLTTFSVITSNASTTSVDLNNLTTCVLYTIRVAACTSDGPGPYSASVSLVLYPHQPPKFYDCEQLSDLWWLILLAGVVCLVILGGCVLCCIQKKHIRAYNFSGIGALSSKFEAAKQRMKRSRIAARPMVEPDRV